MNSQLLKTSISVLLLTLPRSINALATQLRWACVAFTTTLAVVIDLLAGGGT
jgi:hypothetical protein